MEKVLVGNLEAKGPFARLRLRWVEGMILKDFFEGGGPCIGLIWLVIGTNDMVLRRR